MAEPTHHQERHKVDRSCGREEELPRERVPEVVGGGCNCDGDGSGGGGGGGNHRRFGAVSRNVRLRGHERRDCRASRGGRGEEMTTFEFREPEVGPGSSSE